MTNNDRIALPGHYTKPEPFKIIPDFLRNIFPDSAHKDIFRFQADIGFIGLVFDKTVGFKKMNHHLPVLLGTFPGSVKIPCPGIAHKVGNHLLDSRMIKHHMDDGFGDLTGPHGTADLNGAYLDHHPITKPVPSIINIRKIKHPKADNAFFFIKGKNDIRIPDLGIFYKRFPFRINRFVLCMG